jgi:hypothetical protein
MTVTIDKADCKDDWMQIVSDNLKSGNTVALENFDYANDLDKCYILARQFHVKLFIDADLTICHFLTSLAN